MMRIRRPRLLLKVLRLSTFLLFVQLLVTALIVRGVRAEVENLLHSAGAQMLQLGERIGTIEPRTIRLNGAAFRLRVQHVPELTLEQALDTLEARCRARNGRFYELLKEAPVSKQRRLGEAQFALLDGVMRVESPTTGSVACFDVGDQKESPDSILERARRFSETGDVSSFGDLRYARVEARTKGVFLVMMWTDGPFNVRKMFPRQGDAPGVDFPDLPRPPNSRRLLSAWQEGAAPALNVYESAGATPQHLDRHYRAELPKLGWKAMNPAQKTAEKNPHGLLIMRDGVTVTISHSAHQGGAGMTTIMPMDTAGATDESGANSAESRSPQAPPASG